MTFTIYLLVIRCVSSLLLMTSNQTAAAAVAAVVGAYLAERTTQNEIYNRDWFYDNNKTSNYQPVLSTSSSSSVCSGLHVSLMQYKRDRERRSTPIHFDSIAYTTSLYVYCIISKHTRQRPISFFFLYLFIIGLAQAAHQSGLSDLCKGGFFFF